MTNDDVYAMHNLYNFFLSQRLTLKTDAEGALKGNQWPLSSYGPFRDKPCIPNFIEDQSFEEIRHLCECSLFAFDLNNCQLRRMSINV